MNGTDLTGWEDAQAHADGVGLLAVISGMKAIAIFFTIVILAILLGGIFGVIK